MRLLIVDGHEQVRTAFVQRLRRRCDATVLGAAGDVTTAAHLAAELIPDVVLCEPRTLGEDPVAVVRRLAATGRPIAVWTSSLAQGEADLFRRAGAAIALLKDTDLSRLVATLLPLVKSVADAAPSPPLFSTRGRPWSVWPVVTEPYGTVAHLAAQ